MTDNDRAAVLRDVPILSGFLGTLLQDADMSARDSGETGSGDSIYTCPDATFNAAADICRRFLARPGVVDALTDEWGQECHDSDGSDLYLTCAGHGAGFWDGDREPHGDALTAAANSVARDLESYIGDDGHVYIVGGE
jgi:hypothetical protein